MKKDVVALGELLIDFTENGIGSQGNPIMEANPGGAPCNVLAMLTKLGHSTSFIGKVGKDMFGEQLERALRETGIGTEGLVMDDKIHTTFANAGASIITTRRGALRVMPEREEILNLSGAKVGAVGSTGNSTDPYINIEVIDDKGQHVDPMTVK